MDLVKLHCWARMLILIIIMIKSSPELLDSVAKVDGVKGLDIHRLILRI